MNVTIPTRFQPEKMENLKAAAKKHDKSLSVLMTSAMLAVLHGQMELRPDVRPARKQSSLSIEHDVVVAFKDKIKEKGLSLDKALEQLADNLIHTDH